MTEIGDATRQAWEDNCRRCESHPSAICTPHTGYLWWCRECDAYVTEQETTRLRERVAELETALAKYGAHIGHHETGRGPACSRRDGSECDCGLDAALGRQR